VLGDGQLAYRPGQISFITIATSLGVTRHRAIPDRERRKAMAFTFARAAKRPMSAINYPDALIPAHRPHSVKSVPKQLTNRCR
jgi:hypothetical protein